MKLWVVMLILMILIIVGGVYIESTILKTTDHLSRKLDLIQQEVMNDQWSNAVDLCSQIERAWSEQQDKWSPFIHNHDLDVVANQLARLKAHLTAEEQGSSLAEISTIKIHLVQLHHQEVLTIKNIF